MKTIISGGLLVLLLFTACGGNKKPVKTENENGKLVYNKYCLACHQSNGSGVPGMYPSLIKTDWVQGDKSRLINILLKGLKGEMEVNGQVYKSVMPSQDYLNDEQIADVLTYIRVSFGNAADAVSAGEVSAARNRLDTEQ